MANRFRVPQLTPPPTGTKVYAHIHSISMTCPKCGQITTPKLARPAGTGYQASTATFKCPRAKCGYQAYVGVVLWPRRSSGRPTLPSDHVLTPGQAAQLRLELSYAESRSNLRLRGEGEGGGIGQRQLQPVNRVCTCGECPIHPPAESEGGA